MNISQHIQTLLIVVLCFFVFSIYNKEGKLTENATKGIFEIHPVQGAGIFVINRSTGQIKRMIRRGNNYYISSIASDPWEIKEVKGAFDDLIPKDDPSKEQVAKLPTVDELLGPEKK